MNDHTFVDSNLREFIFAAQRKLIPGVRFFSCIDCGEEWGEKSRDCFSPSSDTCPSCGSDVFPDNYEQHSEWPVDKSGNLI